MIWCGDGATEPMENLHLGNEISVLVIMKKLKNGHHFINIDHTEKFQIANPTKVWVSSLLSVEGYGISVLAIIKKLKNGCLCKYWLHRKISNYWPPKVWVSSFPSVNGNRPFWKKLKNDCHFINIDHMEKCQMTNPSKFWTSSFPSVDRNGISVSAVMKK